MGEDGPGFLDQAATGIAGVVAPAIGVSLIGGVLFFGSQLVGQSGIVDDVADNMRRSGGLLLQRRSASTQPCLTRRSGTWASRVSELLAHEREARATRILPSEPSGPWVFSDCDHTCLVGMP